MKRVTHTLLGIVAASLACDPVSRNVGDLQSAEGDSPIDPVSIAHLVCDTEANCCGNQTPESQDNISLAGDCYDEMEWVFRTQAEHAAEYGLQADPSCFERLGECGTLVSDKVLACESPCKLYFGTKTVGETCGVDGLLLVDDCGQGLECRRFVTSSEPCAPGNLQTCEAAELHCVDPCEAEGDTEAAAIGAPCGAGDDGCVAEAFCDPSAVGGSTCVATLDDGQACTSDRQCASRRCGAYEDPDIQGGVCEPSLTDYCADGYEAVLGE